ncbi:MAG: glycosyltransferase family 4 protein [Thermomicrobiales bacterium]|nr:glycosyltransferase family 4 protein [Thermomicrobiales bacterium]MCO5219227.1 glycosyltransferase family 4 protein [Thermomicrobiales bacterium]MCO5225054.1 glycosyltransferase family 4 protein [Thermomicrobiales bacterium]MCO5228106.1 glycosyltransferase family 4 protein [Thermomicrobiales bacterium]
MNKQENHLKVLAIPKSASLISRETGELLSSNPYLDLLYQEVESLGAEVDGYSLRNRGMLGKRYDVIHIHWPDDLFNRHSLIQASLLAIASVLAITLLKLRGAKLIWTAHDVQEFEVRQPWLRRPMWFWFLRQVDGVITLTEAGHTAIYAKYPRLKKVKSWIIPHGLYSTSYENTIDSSEARTHLNLAPENKVILFFGNVRPYKNVPELIYAFRKIEDCSYRLIIAGRPIDQQIKEEISALAADDNRIMLQLDFIQPNDVQVYLNASDILVLPFREILNSGSTHLAISFNKPVLVPKIGSLEEIAEEFGSDLVMTYDGELNAEILTDALEQACSSPECYPQIPDYLQWSSIGANTISAYRELTKL